MNEIINNFYTIMPWVVYVGAGLGLYIIVGTLSSGPGEIQTVSAYAGMLMVYALPPLLPVYTKLTPDLYAVLDVRLIAPVIILLISWAGKDGEWLWGLILSTIPIVSSWFVLSLV